MNDGCKILWAEDESMLREIMCELLSTEGYHCTQASNGDQARQYLEQETFNILITDFNMPELTGDKLLFWCRSRNIHIPVVFVTGYMERKESEELALKDCCTSVLQKPFSIDQLLVEINKAKQRDHDFQCKKIVVSNYNPDYVNTFPNRHQRV